MELLSTVSGIRARDITDFVRQLATLTKSGIAVTQALQICATGAGNRSVNTLVTHLMVDTERGASLSLALRRHPKHFDALFCKLVSVGEQTGSLDALLNEIVHHRERTDSLGKKLRKVLMYSLVVLIVAAISSSLVFDRFLPSPGVMLLGSGALAIAVYIVGKLPGALSTTLGRMVLKLPVVGKIVAKAAVARFARTLAIMYGAGVPLAEAVLTVAGATGSAVYDRSLVSMSNELVRGKQLHMVMTQSGLFSNSVVRLVSTGEETGALDDMLFSVADLNEEDVRIAVEVFGSLIQPILLSIVGIVVGSYLLKAYVF